MMLKLILLVVFIQGQLSEGHSYRGGNVKKDGASEHENPQEGLAREEQHAHADIQTANEPAQGSTSTSVMADTTTNSVGTKWNRAGRGQGSAGRRNGRKRCQEHREEKSVGRKESSGEREEIYKYIDQKFQMRRKIYNLQGEMEEVKDELHHLRKQKKMFGMFCAVVLALSLLKCCLKGCCKQCKEHCKDDQECKKIQEKFEGFFGKMQEKCDGQEVKAEAYTKFDVPVKH